MCSFTTSPTTFGTFGMHNLDTGRCACGNLVEGRTTGGAVIQCRRRCGYKAVVCEVCGENPMKSYARAVVMERSHYNRLHKPAEVG